MKQPLAFITLIIILLLPAPTLAASYSDHIEYNININNDNSATWKIIQVTDINSSIDSLEQFQQRILSAINTARDTTARDIKIDFSSLEMKTDMYWETSSQTIEYIFRLENFSTGTNGKIIFGDVFIDKIFSALYGNGELYVVYPPEYRINSVFPQPNEQNNLTQMLHWYRTQDFQATKPNIVLNQNNTNNNLSLTTLAITFSGLFGAIAVGFILFERRRHRKQNSLQVIEPSAMEANAKQRR